MKITLNSGREIRLSDLNQSYTYAGLIHGLPYRQFNQQLIDEYRMAAQKEMRTDSPAHVLAPPVLEVENAHEEQRQMFERRFGVVERIPFLACRALFLFGGVQRAGEEEDDIAYLSRLAVVWFQDAFAMPIDATILEQIRGINWDTLAEGYSL